MHMCYLQHMATYCKPKNISGEIFSVTDMLANINFVVGSSLKIVNNIHSRLLSFYDVEPLPFALLYLQKINLITH